MTAAPTPPRPRSALALWARSAHDLRQPLHGLKLLTGLLAGEADATARNEICANMAAALQALQTMIDSLAELAAMEASATPPPIAPCGLDTLLADVAAELQPFAAHHGGCVSATANGLVVTGNARWLREIARSLALYALWLKPTAQIGLTARHDGPRTVIEVATTALLPPPAPTRSARLFTEVPALVNATPTLAVGLGMDLMEQVAEQLGATIETTNPAAGGTVYIVRPA